MLRLYFMRLVTAIFLFEIFLYIRCFVCLFLIFFLNLLHHLLLIFFLNLLHHLRKQFGNKPLNLVKRQLTVPDHSDVAAPRFQEDKRSQRNINVKHWYFDFQPLLHLI